MSQKAGMSWKCRWEQTEGEAGCLRGEETEALVSERGDDRETAANKENRCQPSGGERRDHTAKSRFLLFPQSNKTMARRCLIKWVIEGVRALPSAPNILCLTLQPSHTRPLSPLLTVLSPRFQSGLQRSPAACWINAFLGSGSETQLGPTPVRGYGNSNYLLNNHPWAIISPSVYQCRQVQRDSCAHTLPFLWQKKWWRWICGARRGKHTICMLIH